MNNKSLLFKILSGVSFFISLIMISQGHNKMTYYSVDKKQNVYVGEDAYDYIINGNYATAFFVLATLFAILGIGFIVIDYLDKLKEIQVQNMNKLQNSSFKIEKIMSESNGTDLENKINEKLLELGSCKIDSINIVDSKNYGNIYEAYIIYHEN